MARIRKKTNSAPQGFPEKAWNKLSSTWRDAALAKSTEDLEQDLIKAVRSMAGISFEMKNDAKLASLQEQVKELKGAYTETISGEKAKVDFCVYLFNTRGTKVSQSTTDELDSVEDLDEETSD